LRAAGRAGRRRGGGRAGGGRRAGTSGGGAAGARGARGAVGWKARVKRDSDIPFFRSLSLHDGECISS